MLTPVVTGSPAPGESWRTQSSTGPVIHPS